MYIIENDIVYKEDIYNNGTKSKVCIGNEIQYKITKTSSQIIYQWQKFNIKKGMYEDDITNTTPIEGQMPVKGKVVTEKVLEIVKEPVDQEKVQMAETIIDLNNKIDELQNKLNGGK
ncbi:hypothetical protein [Clostridium sp. JS66]|uniref:hypothetical protein n=1 Tax=Clostridium sp. JS66 TaxID=3064705 RepID=UPI00298DA80A|nr:hypothetical protein [Clostridium sp. JS66]WPC41213.1 hypothetical protein Q6H37_25490 [Clostridium sp. JS66]